MNTRQLLRLACAAFFAPLAFPAFGADEPLNYEQHVRPIFKAYCLDCHGAGAEVSGQLDLRLRRFVLKGGDSGAAMVPGNAAESLLIKRMKSGEMPPGEKKVPADQIAVIEKWIATGAAARREEPESLPAGIDITPEDRAWWAFLPLARPPLPAFGPQDGIRNGIDTFVLAKLRAKGLGFNPEADRLTLIRRATFDLTGLPPSQAEIDAFLADTNDGAYERLVDRLLDSPHYGERWARHWLDVAGYADSDGDGTNDTVRPYAWKYRDYVIRSLNADKPLDRFVIEQLAGDELVPRPLTNLTTEQIDLLTATGFLRMAIDPTAAGGDQALNANQVVADTLKIVGSSLLGVTVGCAQCHDHRYDPVPQTDYYRLRAVFEPAWNPAAWKAPGARLVSLMTDAQRAERTKIEGEEAAQRKIIAAKQQEWIDKIFDEEVNKFPEAEREPLRAAFKAPVDKLTPEQKKLVDANPKLRISAGVIYQFKPDAAEEIKKLTEALGAISARKPVEDFVQALAEDANVGTETKLFHRGDHRQPKQTILPGDLTIAAADGARYEINPKDAARPTTGRRLAFAQHLMSGTHPLVGRVLANRIWLHHFGQGLTETPGDLGKLGTLPSHPELLDWLAVELGQGTEGKWSMKRFHRLVMTSTVYRQSSKRDPSKDAADSENRLLGRFPVRRLDAETLRDRMLVASGRFDATPFGPAIAPTEDFVGQVVADSPRRSIYLQARRSRPVSFLAAFDAPLMAVNCERRIASTTAPQSLMLMNSDFVVAEAARLADRTRRDTPAGFAKDAVATLKEPAPGRLPEFLAGAWQIAYQRPATSEELQLASDFCKQQLAHLTASKIEGDHERIVLTNVCQQLLNSNEFLYVD